MPIPSVSLSVKNASVKEWLNRLPLLICALGILVRSVQYLSNRSIWLDEARLLLNIVERSYLDLLRPLDHNQAAPPGFLLVERLNLELFGNNEYALRLFPFICGILSIFVFYQLAKQLLPKSTFLIALVLFNCMPRLVYFSSEAKQYSSDLFVALLLTWLLYHWRDRVLNLKQQLLLGLAGVVAIGFSHPAVFTLGGTEAALFLMAGKQRWHRLKNRIPAYVMWLAAFAALYFLMVQSTLEANEELVDSWGRRYPTSIFDVGWLINNVATKYCGYFYSFLGASTLIDILVTLVFLVGCVAFYRRDRRNFFILVAPVGLTLIAAYLQKYPFQERLILFLTPFFVMMTAVGIQTFFTQIRPLFFRIVAIALASILLISPVVQAKPQKIEEVRSITEYMMNHYQIGDGIYVYRRCFRQFIYYANRAGFPAENYKLGNATLPRHAEATPAELANFKKDIAPFDGKARTWVLVCRANKNKGTIEQQFDQMGKRIDEFKPSGATAYLYDLR